MASYSAMISFGANRFSSKEKWFLSTFCKNVAGKKIEVQFVKLTQSDEFRSAPNHTQNLSVHS